LLGIDDGEVDDELIFNGRLFVDKEDDDELEEGLEEDLDEDEGIDEEFECEVGRDDEG
jgi:hypothetical protein